jgi:hypothetical protein
MKEPGPSGIFDGRQSAACHGPALNANRPKSSPAGVRLQDQTVMAGAQDNAVIFGWLHREVFMIRALFLFVFSGLCLYPQSQSNSADLRGTVTDPSGASVPGATLTITDPKTGLTRTSRSDESGNFLFRLLPPSQYELRVEATGFATRSYSDLELRVGETATINVPLAVGQTETEIQVVSEIPVIETARYQQSSTVEYRSITNLPINKRNYLDFVLLTPGVSNTDNLAAGNDFRVAQAPHSGLSFGGGNGRANAFFVDGLENVNNSGAVRNSVSQEAVQEFQINRNSFSAEYGWTLGGAVNIVTRAGTNSVHGNVFGFLRTTGSTRSGPAWG